MTPPSSQVWLWVEGDDRTRTYFRTISDDDGHYRLDGLPAGELEGRIIARALDGEPLERVFTLRTLSGQVTEQDLEVAW